MLTFLQRNNFLPPPYITTSSIPSLNHSASLPSHASAEAYSVGCRCLGVMAPGPPHSEPLFPALVKDKIHPETTGD